MTAPPQRVSPIHAQDDYRLPGRPEGAPASVLDAYRQTQFLLGADLALFEEAMNLQLRLMKNAYPAKYRTHLFAGIGALWSRAFMYLTDGLLLATRASYASTLPLVRGACEVIAAEEGLRSRDPDEHNIWLASTLKPSERHKAFEFELGRYFAGSVLADDPILRAVYRPVSDLGRPNFGASLLQTGPESNNVRVAVTFADTTFHLGWAEAVIGWLLALAARQVRVAVECEPLIPVADDVKAAFFDLQRRVDAALARDDRCWVEEIDESGTRRYLFHNFRRASGAAPRKILL